MRRRDFLRVAGGAALTGPTISLAEPVKRVRQIGVLTSFGEGDKSGQSWLVAFRQKLLELGWVLARDYNVEYRFTAGDTNRMRTYAGELAALKPDVILVAGTGVVGTARSLLTSLPVVFVQVTDPVGTGFVGSLAHPGGNMTGFTSFEYSMGGKWLELLKEVQPAVSQVSVIENPDNANHIGYLSSIEDAASAMHVRVISAGVRDPTEIDGAFKKIVGEGIGIIVPPDPFTLSLRGAIVALASRYRIPSVYAFRPFVVDGGLMCYGVDNDEMYRGAASYVSRILRGEKPADLPVQASNKFVLTINMRAAQAIALAVPQTLLARADEVIE